MMAIPRAQRLGEGPVERIGNTEPVDQEPALFFHPKISTEKFSGDHRHKYG
jgi:hypothetical protein